MTWLNFSIGSEASRAGEAAPSSSPGSRSSPSPASPSPRGRAHGDRAVDPGHADRTGHRAPRRGVPGSGRRQRHGRLPDGGWQRPDRRAEGRDQRRVAAASGVDGVASVIDPFATQADRATQEQQIVAGRAQLDGRRLPSSPRVRLSSTPRGRRPRRPGPSIRPLPGLAAKQAELDQGKAQLDAQRSKLDQGAALLEMSSGIRLVSEDGSAAVAPVMFEDTQFGVSAGDQAGRRGRLQRAADPGRRRSTSRPRSPRASRASSASASWSASSSRRSSWSSCSAPSSAPALPILTALVGVAIGVLGALSLSGVVDMVSVTPVLGVMLGLAVGIDYSLFIVNRHRRQLQEGYGAARVDRPRERHLRQRRRLRRHRPSSSRSSALNVTGIPFLGLMGTVGAASVAIAVLIAVTFTPALLGLIGERVLRGRERAALAARRGPRRRAARPPDVDPAGVRPRAARRRRARRDGRSRDVDAPRPARRLVRVPALDPVPRLHDRRREVRRGRRTARSSSSPTSRGPRPQDEVLADQVRIGRRSPRSTTSSRSRRSARRPTAPRSPSRSSRPTGRRASPPSSSSRSSGRPRRSTAASSSPSPARPAATSTSRRSWRTPCRSTSRSSSGCRC